MKKTKAKAVREHHERQLTLERKNTFHVRLQRDAETAEVSRLRAVVRELEKRLNIPEEESRATIKRWRPE